MGVFFYFNGFIKNIMKKRSVRLITYGLGLFLVCMLFMMGTDPGNSSLAVLLVPFFTFGVGVYMVVRGLVMAFSQSMRLRVQRFIALTVSSVLVLMLLLKSLNQFTIRDAAILVVLVTVMALYVIRADFLSEISSNRDNTGV